MEYQHKEARNNVLRPLFVSLTFLFLVIYGVLAFNSGGFFWFLSNTAEAEPIRIIIIDNGDKILYRPGEPEFEALTPVIRDAISDLNNNSLVTIGLSDVTLEEYQTRFTVMEVHYDRPLDFGTSFRTGNNTTRLLFPITGRHAAVGLFFRGNEDGWMYGGLRMQDSDPLYTSLEELGFKAAVFAPTGSNDPANGG